MRATSLQEHEQEHEAERYNHAVVGMESSHLQQGCEAPRLTSRERAVLELLCRYDHVPQVAGDRPQRRATRHVPIRPCAAGGSSAVRAA